MQVKYINISSIYYNLSMKKKIHLQSLCMSLEKLVKVYTDVDYSIHNIFRMIFINNNFYVYKDVMNEISMKFINVQNIQNTILNNIKKKLIHITIWFPKLQCGHLFCLVLDLEELVMILFGGQ